MTFNSTVVLKGMQKPIFTSKLNATAIQKMMSDGNISYDFVIQIGNQSFRKGDIKFVEVLNDGDDSRKNDEYLSEFYDTERKEREYMANKSAEDKASKLDLFCQLYQSATGRSADQETLTKARKIQLDFFEANPKRTLCDLQILKQIIPKLENYTSNAFFQETPLLFRGAFFRLVEKAVYRDMQLSGQFIK